MSICIKYPDTITLITTQVDTDGYNTPIIDTYEDVPAIFNQSVGSEHSNNQEEIISDADAFVDPSNSFVSSNVYRLEEMYVLASKFGSPDAISWYKVIRAVVSQDSQFANAIDNVQIFLQKTEPIGNVS